MPGPNDAEPSAAVCGAVLLIVGAAILTPTIVVAPDLLTGALMASFVTLLLVAASTPMVRFLRRGRSAAVVDGTLSSRGVVLTRSVRLDEVTEVTSTRFGGRYSKNSGLNYRRLASPTSHVSVPEWWYRQHAADLGETRRRVERDALIASLPPGFGSRRYQ